MPRRRETGDSKQADRLRERLFFHLREREMVPDQTGKLCARRDLSCPPEPLIRLGKEADPVFDRWAAYPGRPRDWLHHRALTRNRLAVIDRLCAEDASGSSVEHFSLSPPGAPWAAIAAWLEALVKEAKEEDDAVEASRTAVRIAEAIPDQLIRTKADLGRIVLTADGAWSAPVPNRLFLPDDTESVPDEGTTHRVSYVHPELVSDRDTHSALKKLGLKALSPENSFRNVARRLLGGGIPNKTQASILRRQGDLHREFWASST